MCLLFQEVLRSSDKNERRVVSRLLEFPDIDAKLRIRRRRNIEVPCVPPSFLDPCSCTCLLTRNISPEVPKSNRKPKDFVAKMGLYDPYFRNR